MTPTDYKAVLFGPPDEPSSTMAVVRGERADILDEIQTIADHIDDYGTLPVGGDICDAVPAEVVARYRNGNLRIRCDAFERESERGTSAGFGYIMALEYAT